MVELVTKADLLATEQRLQTSLLAMELLAMEQRFQAKLDTQALQLTVRLGAIQIAASGALVAILKLT